MNTTKTIILISFIIVSFNSCKDNINSPIEMDNTTPGSRNYNWKTDTLNLDGWDYLGSLWGSSAEDVWAAGTGGLFHYDGAKWIEYVGMRWNLECLYGFTSNNIWTIASGNYNGVNIFHYDGSKWNNTGLFTNQTSDGYLGMNDVWGNSPNNIYAVGFFNPKNTVDVKAVIMHFNGSKWSFLNLPQIDYQLVQIRQDMQNNGKYYLWGIHSIWDTTQGQPIHTGEIIKLFEFDGTNLTEISSNWIEYWSMTSMNNSVYFHNKNKLWVYRNNSFLNKIDLSGYEYSIGLTKGRSEKDIFSISRNKDYSDRKYYFTHYNGTDLVSLFSGDYIRQFEIIGNDIFVLSLGSHWMVTHGTLNK